MTSNRIYRFFLLCGIAAMCAALLAPSAYAWEQTIDGGASDAERARTVAILPSGDVVAAGTLEASALGDIAVVCMDAETGTVIWSVTYDGSASGEDEAVEVLVDAAGNVLVAGNISNAITGNDMFAAKLDPVDGSEIWRVDIDGTASGLDIVRGAAVDAADNLIITGSTQDPTTVLDVIAVKLAAATGAELWRSTAAGTSTVLFMSIDEGWDVALDASGNAFVAASMQNDITGNDMAVIKFDATTGSEIWRQTINGTDDAGDFGNTLAIDASGDVIAVGSVDNLVTNLDTIVIKLNGASGAEVWRTELDDTNEVRDIVIDALGHPIVAGQEHSVATLNDFIVLKFDGTSGSETWRSVLDGTASGADEAGGISLDSNGDVVATGFIKNTGTDEDLVGVKLDGATGATLWAIEFDGTASLFDNGNATAVDAADRVVIAGGLDNTGTSTDFYVVKVQGADGAPYLGSTEVFSKKLKVKDKAGDPSKRLIVYLARDPLIVPALAGSDGDPTLGGAELRLFNPTSLEEDVISLPAGGWTVKINAAGSIYKYKDAALANGPCRVALLKAGRAKAVCKGSQIAFSLDEASQGALAVRLRSGNAKPICGELGGDVKKDVGSGVSSTGLFLAKDAAAPLECPIQ